MANDQNSNSRKLMELSEQNQQLISELQKLRADEALRKESDEKFRNIVDTSPLGILLYTMDEDERLIFIGYNKSAERLLETELSDRIGLTIEEAFPGLTETEIPYEYRKVALTGKEFSTKQIDYDSIKGAYEVRVYQVSPNNIAVNFDEITERLKKEEELINSRHKFKSLFDNVEEGIALHKMIFDENGNPVDFVWIDANRKYEELTQLKAEDIIGKKGREIIPNIEKSWYDMYARVAKTGVPETMVDHSEYLNKYWEVKAFSPEQGHFAVAMTDVTEREVSQQKLIKAKRKAEQNGLLLKSIAENYPNSYVSVIENDYTVGFTSGHEFKRVNLNPDDFVGMSLDQVFGKDSEFVKEKYRETFAGNETSFELYLNNQIQYYRTVPLIDENGDIQRILVVAENITERKKVEEELRNSREVLQATLETAMDGYWVVDMKGKFIEINTTYCNMSGYSKEELLQMTIPDVEAIDDAAKVNQMIHDISQLGQSRFETKHLRKDGSVFDVEVSVQYQRMREGQFVCFIKDITERKNVENLLIRENRELTEAKKRAEESDRLKTAFLSNMSHEIRTPMNGIVGFTQLLQNPDLNEKNQKEYLEIIRKSSDRLLNTVNDIVEISKIESGVIELSRKQVDIVQLLNSMVNFFKPECEKKGLEITIDNDLKQNELFCNTDKTKMNSIISNLIKNAIKYTNEGYIKTGIKLQDHSLVYYCEDSGIGIPPDRQKAIFNRFEQADIEDREVHQGSGLGLSIVKSYVEMLEGKIRVESVEGKGSVFYVTFPHKSENEQATKNLSHGKAIVSMSKDVNVLIAEDDETSSLHFSIISDGIFKKVKIVSNGKEAVEEMKKDLTFNLVLMDIKMPEMDGYEATRQIREFNKDVIIIAQTAFAFEEDKRKMLAAGFNDVITKPVKLELLLDTLDQFFSELPS